MRKAYSFIILILLAMACPLSSVLASEPTRIQLWHQMIYSHRQILRAAADAYEKNHPDVRVQITYRETEELRSAYQSAAMGGSGPELIYGPSDQVGPFATMGIIRPLNEAFDTGPLSTYLKDFDPLAVIQFGGKPYMVGDRLGNHLMLIYNKKLIAEPPRNTDELIRIGRAQTKDLDGDGKIDRYGLVWNFTEPFFFVPWIAGFNDWFFTESNQPRLNTDATVRAFAFVKSLRDEHKIVPQECDYEIANALFKDGKAAMIINGDWSWGDYKAAGIDFGIARLPMVSETGQWPSPIVSTTGYSLNVHIPPEKLPKVLDLLRYLTSPEVQLRFAKEAGTLPSHLGARETPFVKNDEILKSSVDIMSVGHPMPVVPEIRAVWDALRGQYQAVLGGITLPAEAAKLAQAKAELQISEMNEVIEPGAQTYVIWAFVLIVAGIAIYWSVKGVRAFINGLSGPNRIAYLMMLPAFIAVFAVVIFPFLYNVAVSLSNFSLRTFKDWHLVGLQHYGQVLTDQNFYLVFLKTIIWTGTNLVFHVVLGVGLALLINQTLPAKPLLRTLLIIPWAVPQYITALTWRAMFNQEYGSINLMLTHFFHMSPVQWLSSPAEAFTACILTNIWLGFPFMMVVALGGLQAIPQQMYEAAKVDGANSIQRFVNITWPMLKPVMIPAITLGVIWTFNSLNVIWLVSSSGEPADSTHILVSYVYKSAFNLYRYGYSAAFSMIIFFILFAFGIGFLNRTKADESVY
jgi:arabinogalactan oligomer/maltooligosaccharide transport system permease protein